MLRIENPLTLHRATRWHWLKLSLFIHAFENHVFWWLFMTKRWRSLRASPAHRIRQNTAIFFIYCFLEHGDYLINNDECNNQTIALNRRWSYLHVSPSGNDAWAVTWCNNLGHRLCDLYLTHKKSLTAILDLTFHENIFNTLFLSITRPKFKMKTCLKVFHTCNCRYETRTTILRFCSWS